MPPPSRPPSAPPSPGDPDPLGQCVGNQARPDAEPHAPGKGPGQRTCRRPRVPQDPSERASHKGSACGRGDLTLGPHRGRLSTWRRGIRERAVLPDATRWPGRGPARIAPYGSPASLRTDPETLTLPSPYCMLAGDSYPCRVEREGARHPRWRRPRRLSATGRVLVNVATLVGPGRLAAR